MHRIPAVFIFTAILLIVVIKADAQPMDYPSGSEPQAPLSWEMYRQQQVEIQLENQRRSLELRQRQLEIQQQHLELQRQQLEIQKQQQQLEFEKQKIEGAK